MSTMMPINPIQTGQQNIEKINKGQNECRICLEGDQLQNRLIEPCNCKGSVSFIHQNCLLQWVTTQIEKKQNPNKMKHQEYNIYSIKCQMCKTNIYFEMNKKIGCKSCDEVTTHLKSHPIFYTIYITVFLCILGMITFLGIWYSKKPDYSQPQNQASRNQQWMWLVLLILILLLSLGACKVIWDFTIGLFICIKNSEMKISKKSIKSRQQNTQFHLRASMAAQLHQ